MLLLPLWAKSYRNDWWWFFLASCVISVDNNMYLADNRSYDTEWGRCRYIHSYFYHVSICNAWSVLLIVGNVMRAFISVIHWITCLDFLGNVYLHWSDTLMTLIARFMGPTWGPSGTDRAKVGPMLATWTVLSTWASIAHLKQYISIYVLKQKVYSLKLLS